MESFDVPPSQNTGNCSNNQVSDCSCSHEKRKLTDYSPRDKPWDRQRGHADDIEAIYFEVREFKSISRRIKDCADQIAFAWVVDCKTGVLTFKLKKAFFCRCRYCPVCQWRRSLMWKGRFLKSIPKILEKYPNSRWLLLTLTVRNCEIETLSAELKWLNKSWDKLIKRKDLSPIQGWIRTTEVTYNADDRSAHPHFHTLLMVPTYWFTHGYVKHARWVELWRESLKINYDPNVDIRVVKAKKGTNPNQSEFLEGIVGEVLKYATKADHLKADKAWLLELTRQTHKKRFLASGGALKDIMQEDKPEKNQDFVTPEDNPIEPEPESKEPETWFNWNNKRRNYETIE